MDFLKSVFGSGLSDFLRGCDRSHPDLLTVDVAEFLAKTDQIYEAALFCRDRGLKDPLETLCSSAPKSHPFLFSMVRTLKEDFRRESRRRKSFVRFDLESFFSFEKGKATSFVSAEHTPLSNLHSSDRTQFWAAAAERLSSIGCHRMANAAKDLSLFDPINRTRLSRFPLARAVASLCERGASRLSGRFWVGPAFGVSLPKAAEDSIYSCEAEMGGFPIFDHYFLVVSALGDSPPDSVSKDFFVLGERDGQCHFVFSD